jgi:hypothetical protein
MSGGQRERVLGGHTDTIRGTRALQIAAEIVGGFRVVGARLEEAMTYSTRWRSSPKGLPFGSEPSDRGGVHVDHDEGEGS